VRMRFRTDGWHYADLKAEGKDLGSWCVEGMVPTEEEKKYWEVTQKAEPGDVWRIHWYHRDEDDKQLDDWIAGYAICCIGCGRVHCWTSALNCGQRVQRSYVDTNGNTVPYETCVHQEAHGSCWQWSGSAEEGTLTAAPSLQVVADRCPWKCGWHGFIQNGDIHI
jgi:hypothetical protein